MFNFWPFNVALKRREAEREKRIAQLVEDMARPQPKRNKVIPMDDPRHPRNLTPEPRLHVVRTGEMVDKNGLRWQAVDTTVRHGPRIRATLVREPSPEWHAMPPIYVGTGCTPNEPESRCDSPSSND